MANTVTTLRPNATVSSTGWSATGGTLPTLLADNSDASYAAGNALSSGSLTMDLGTFAFPANSQIRTVTPRVRAQDPSGPTPCNIQFGIVVTFFNRYISVASGLTPATIYTLTGTTYSVNPYTGLAWTQLDIDALQVTNSFDRSNQQLQIYEYYVDVGYNQAPVVSAVGVTSNLFAKPTVTWTYTDPESDTQERYRVKIYAGTGTVADPDNTAAYYDSGEVFASSASHAVTTALAGSSTGTSYRIYVKAADVGSNGRYSAWATATVSIVIDPPATPEIAAWADSALARIGIKVQGYDNELQGNPADFEAFAAEWVAVTAAPTVARQTTQVLHGVGALGLTATAAATMTAGLAAAYRPAVSPGRLYEGMAWLRTAVTSRQVNVSLAWYTSGGSLISTTAGMAAWDNTTGWTQVMVSGVAPATAASVQLQATVVAAAIGEVHYLDQALVAPVPVRNMLTFAQQSFETDLSTWVNNANAALARSAAFADEGVGSMALTPLVNGTNASAAHVAGGTNGAPVTPGQSYSASARFRSSGTVRSALVNIAWYTAAGALVSTSAGSGVTEVAGSWITAALTAVAPATAAFAIVQTQVTTPSETHYIDRVQISIASINLLTPNQASIETDATGWGSTTNANLARSTTKFADGVASLSIAAVAAGTMSAKSSPLNAAPVTPGVSYMAQAVFLAQTTPHGVQVNINWRDASTAILSTTTGSPTTDSTTIWTQVAVTGVAPAGAAYATVELVVNSASAIGEVHNADTIYLLRLNDGAWSQGDFAAIGTYVIVERSTDGGTTWLQVRGAYGWNSATLAGSQVDAPATQQYVVYDYEIARNTPALYRARIMEQSGKVSANGQIATAVQHAATGWWLKDPLAPAANMQLDVQPGFSFKRKEPQSVLQPLGRSTAVVITDGVKGIEGTIEVWSKDSTRYAKLQDLVDNGRNLWLEDVFGRAWYVHLGDSTSWSLLRAQPLPTETTPIRHVHSVQLPFTEVGSPTGDLVAAGTPTG